MSDMYFLICLEYLQSYSTYTAISTLEKREIAVSVHTSLTL